MSIVMWKVLETKVASDEEDILYRRVKARLERLSQESAVPIGANWDNPPRDEPADRSDTAPVTSEPETKLLAPAADAEFELVVEEHEPAQVVAVEERQAPPATLHSTRPSPRPRPAGMERDPGPRVSRAITRPRAPAAAAPLRAVAVKPVEAPWAPAAGRRTTVRTTPSS